MGILSQKGLESLLEPLKNKIDNFMPKTGGKFTGPISIGNENNTSTISVEDSYARITSGNTKMDITNNGDILINSKNIFEKDDSLKLGKIVNSNPESNIIEAYQRNRPTPYMFFNGSAVAIGTDIYILGSQYTDSESTHPYAEYNYKYDTTTNTYTKNKDIPYSFFSGSAVAIGTDIYLLGNNKYNYKYDTTTNTYTKNTDIPYSFNYGSAVSIGNNIYLFGIYSGSYSKYNYKYDTTTDTYSKMSDIPYNFIEGSAVSIGNNIYLLGSTSYNTSNNFDYRQNNYKYDTTTDSYIRCKNLPYKFYQGSAVAIGNYIYLLGGNNSDTSNYRYDITTNTYTKNKDIPYQIYRGSAVTIGNDIYLLGSYNSNYYKYNYKYTPQHTEATSTAVECNGMIKLSNHSIYTESNSYTDTNASIIPIEDNNYTEYNGNNIIKNTFSIDSNGNTKMYIKQGAILNGKEVTCETEGWQDINLLEYM